MKIGIIVGSNRDNAQSLRVGKVIKNLLGEIYQDVECDVFSLNTLDVNLWASAKWDAQSDMYKGWKPISHRLSLCDGFVVICPEWAGMATPHLKNFLLMCDKGELAHKPALIVCISTGRGGAYPVSELRMSGYKNSYIWWLPDHIICQYVDALFGEDETEDSLRLQERIRYCLRFLVESSHALAPVRKRNQDLKRYPFGM